MMIPFEPQRPGIKLSRQRRRLQEETSMFN
uniref:Uncharacterized protein n=1 Tax=Tetranychus urticae TaxID=32264 RepID=T1JPX1_TETUR